MPQGEGEYLIMPVTIERRTMRKDNGWAAWNGNEGIFLSWADGESYGHEYHCLHIIKIFKQKTVATVRVNMRRLSPKEMKAKKCVEIMGISTELIPACLQIMNMLAQERLRGDMTAPIAQPVGRAPVAAAVSVEMDEEDRLMTKLGMIKKA